MLGNGAIDLLHQAGAGNSHLASWLHKPGQVVQVEIVGAVVDEGIDSNNGVKEVNPEWQVPRIGMHWEHAIGDPRISDSLSILRDVKPQVRCPNLYTKLAMEED